MTDLAQSLLLALAVFVATQTQLQAQGTAFTYQGRLNVGVSPANGLYDFRFRLASDPFGNDYVGSAYLTNAIGVTNGLFATKIDFGAGIFTGGTNWLEVDVKTNLAGAYAVLSPLQQVTPTPSAIFAETAASLNGTVSAAQLSGVVANGNLPSNPTVSGTVTAGAFSGNGANVTNINAANLTGALPPAILPAGVVTNTETGVTLSGVFNGNGSGLTNVTATVLMAPQGMALIPAGTFSMGDSLDGESDATPTTNIMVSAFYMDMNLVTYAQWQSVYFWATNDGYTFDNVGSGKAANHPVQTVNWYDAVKWCNARSEQAGLTPVYSTNVHSGGLTIPVVYRNGDIDAVNVNSAANGYRLPTEAEWEKAARGGLSGQRFPWGNLITEYLANYYGDTNDFAYDLGPSGYYTTFASGIFPYTSPVGYFAPNGYGLYDITDDVTEWCWDWFGTPYGQPSNTNPTGPATGSFRMLRGGSWTYYAFNARCAGRNYNTPNDAYFAIGFRCVRGH